MEHMSVLQMGEPHIRTQANGNQFTLGADDYAYSSVSKLPSHRHQGIDKGRPFREVLSEEQRRLAMTRNVNNNGPTL